MEENNSNHPIKLILNGWVWKFLLAIACSFSAGVYVDDIIHRSSDKEWVDKGSLRKLVEDANSVEQLQVRIRSLTEEIDNKEIQLFERPSLRKGYLIDNCLSRSTNCGQPAADKFCTEKGFSLQIGYQVIDGVNTWIFNDNQPCLGCRGFKYITCKKTPMVN